MADNWKILQYKNILPVQVIDKMNNAVDTLATALTALTKILKLLQFFISSFNSFSVILQTFVNFAQKQISQFTGDLLNAGVYFNVLIPPAFLKSFSDPKNSTGGYEGFLKRMKVSLNNPADKNAPQFSDNAVVGGLIILCDTETLIDFFKGLRFLAEMFDFFKLFPINTEPLPPRNVRAISGYFQQSDGTKKLGVRLTWDAPRVGGFTNYRISRSQKQGGNLTTTHPIPTRLIGPKGRENEGILKAAEYRFASGAKEWPPVMSYEYNDASFNEGKPVVVRVNPVNGSGGYVDYDIDPKAPESSKKYYYVVESGFPILWGPRTPETAIAVNLKGCINGNQQEVIQHKKSLEFVSSGAASLGMWSSIQTKALLPFLDTTVNILNKFLGGLAGAIKTNSKSFVDFMNGIVQKIQTYKDILSTLIEMILAIEAFFAGAPRIAFLNVPPAAGGTDGFVRRVTNATKPVPGFSGINGYTVGVVLVYGEANFELEALPEAEAKLLQAELKVKSAALAAAFNLLIKALT